MHIIIAAIAFTVVFIALVALFRYLTQGRQAMRTRIERYVELVPPATAHPATTAAPPRELAGWRVFIRRAGKYFEWSDWSRTVEHKLVQAGLPLKGSEFAAICFGTPVLGAILGYILTGGKAPLMPVAGAIFGYMLPRIFLNLKIKQRAKAFNLQLADALILVANSLRTGYSFLQAVELVSREMAPPISVEFTKMLKEMNLGVTTEDAMNNLAKRIDSDDLDLVVTSVLIQRQVGGNLAEVLDNIAGTIRERLKIKGEIKTLTAQGRMSGLIIGFLPFALALVIYLMNPGYLLTLFTHPVGKMLLMMSFAGMVIGFFWIRKIVNIEL